MGKIKRTLQSRKFWVAVASSALFALNEQYQEAVAVWLGWAVVEGYIDAKKVELLPLAVETVDDTADRDPAAQTEA